MTPRQVRFALFYATLFFIVGIQIPYWPVWLQDRGLGVTEIGILVATQLWVKVAFNPLVGHAVDHTGRRRPILFALSLMALSGMLLFPLAHGFFPLLALSIFYGATFAAILPVADNLTMTHVVRRGMDYGRVRLWGSLSFIAASTIGGWALDLFQADVIIWLTLLGLAPLCLTVLRLPNEPSLESITNQPRLHWRDLLRSRVFWTFIAATACIGASHAAYYGFATLHWQRSGIGHTWIGILWGIGVCMEVMLFAFSRHVVQIFGPVRLIIIGGLAATIRWTFLGALTDPWLLLAVQTLHGLTFGATHLGAMHFIAQRIAPSVAGRAQGLYAAMGNGVVLGLVTIAAGSIYAYGGSMVFDVMAIISLCGTVLAFRLLRGEQARTHTNARFLLHKKRASPSKRDIVD